jgi:hypothetical protein
MTYSIKTEIYKEGLPFNKWFNIETGRKEKVRDLAGILGIDHKTIGIVMINNKPITANRVLEDRDSIRFIGKIYPEYL